MNAETMGRPNYVAVPGSPCMSEVDRLGWWSTVPVRAGDLCLGVRVSSLGLDRFIRTVFADRIVPDGDPPPNLSVLLAEPRGRLQELHRLYGVHRRLVRTRSARRVLDALWQELDAHDARARNDGLLVDATVFVRADGAHVLPAWARPAAVDAERRWARDGFQLVDRRWVALDVEAGALTVPASGLLWGDGADGELDRLGVKDRPDPPQPAGTWPIATWTPFSGDDSPAGRVVEAAGQVLDRSSLGSAGWVASLAELLAEVPQVAARWERIDEVRLALAAR